MSDCVLVAGGTGRLGSRLVQRLKATGYRVRVLARDPARLGALAACVDDVVRGDLTAAMPAGLCDGVDLVFSCAGASTRLLDTENETSFENINHYGNVGLLRAALGAGVQKFMYVAPLGAERLADTAFGGAHERFVQTLHRSTIPHTVIRTTAYFEHIDEAFALLRAGHPWLFGEGPARTNPIHEEDLAEFCVQALDSSYCEVQVGGPEVHTRSDIAAMARVAAATIRVPQSVARLAGPSPDNPRIRDLLEFGARIALLDVVGPEHGTRSLVRHIATLARTGAPPYEEEAPPITAG